MKILHVEDDAIKHANIYNQIKQVVSANISWAKSYDEGIGILFDDEYDLIITDMSYPIHAGETPNDDAGDRFIEYIKAVEIDTPIVLVTAFGMKKKDILATVQYRENTEWESEIKNIVRKLKKEHE